VAKGASRSLTVVPHFRRSRDRALG
jgi:hypothetical protein